MTADFIGNFLKSISYSHRWNILLAKMSSNGYLKILTDVLSVLNDQVSDICIMRRWQFVNLSSACNMGNVLEMYELVAMFAVDPLICCLVQIHSLVFSV
jgi:hypothetical protein